MAILKNLLVNGSSRFLNKIYCSDVEISGDIGCSNLEVTGNITTGGDITLSGAIKTGVNGLYINNKQVICTSSSADTYLRINELCAFTGIVVGADNFYLNKANGDQSFYIDSGNTTITGSLNVGDTIYGKIGGCYGTSNTGATTQIKSVISPGFVLYAGALITVKFSTANTYSSAKIQLNVNTTGAKDIWIAGASTSATNQLLWGTNATITFRYDGTQFIVVGDPATYYGASTTAAGTAAKTDTTACTSAVIRKGTVVRLSMTNANTATAPTLNINGTGAKNLYAGNSTTRPLVSNGLSWIAGSTVGFVFDGAYWRIADTAGLASAYEASKVATNFITPVTNAGIQLHEANNTNDYYQIKSDGHYFYNGGNMVALFSYGTTVTAGGSSTTKPYYTFGTRLTGSTIGPYSMAIGVDITSSGENSIGVGYKTISSGLYSAAFGSYSESSGSYGFATGYHSTASGFCSTAIGNHVTSSSDSSIAMGYYTTASGNYSTAMGSHTVATTSSSTAIGKYNVATRSGSGTEADPYTYTNAGNYAFIIGNGTGDATANRSNALTVDWSGNLVASGSVAGTNIVASGSVSDADGSLGVKVAEFGFNVTINSLNGTGSFQVSDEIKNGYLATIITQIWPLSTWGGADAGVAQISFDSSNPNQINVIIASSSAQTYGVVARVLYRG